MPAQIQKNNIGVAFRGTVKDQDDNIVDVSAATTLELIFYKPNKTRVVQTASFYTNGTDGVIQYISQSGDLDIAGMWRQQAHIIQSGTEFYSDVLTFKVFPNLEDNC